MPLFPHEKKISKDWPMKQGVEHGKINILIPHNKSVETNTRLLGKWVEEFGPQEDKALTPVCSELCPAPATQHSDIVDGEPQPITFCLGHVPLGPKKIYQTPMCGCLLLFIFLRS